MNSLPKALYISHGGGPLPLLGDPAHAPLVACLEKLAAEMPRPDAILVVSAHWESAIPAITAAAIPALLYDYHGFPQESYEIAYPCPGEPALARDIQRMLAERGIDSRLDEQRGLDHGVFVPLKLMYPRADIPCVQLSLVEGLDPALHIDIGAALHGMSARNVLLIGSGSSFHNLRQIFGPAQAESARLNEAFEDWLQEVCAGTSLGEQERRARLIDWKSAPGGRFCHPREEHLLPLHVCYGAAAAPCAERQELSMFNRKLSIYSW